jgi:hypothetical protein
MSQAEDFTLDLTGEDVAKRTPNAGGAFHRVQYADYKFRIVDVEQQAKEGEKPHVMIVCTFSIVAAHELANAGEVGQQMTGRYAGSPQSPKFMQERLANLIKACALQLPPGQKLKRSMLVGREFDASVVWTKGQPKMDMETGQTRTPVYANVIGERPVGAPRPPTIDPVRDSRDAAKHVAAEYGDDSDDEVAAPAPTPAPWTAPASTAGVTTTVTPPAPASTSSWRDEAEATPAVHQYRAHIKLETAHAAAARQGLIGIGFDPDGPLDVAHLDDATKAQYLAKFPVGAPGGLPGLPPATAPTGNGAAPAAAKPRTGTRAPRAQ